MPLRDTKLNGLLSVLALLVLASNFPASAGVGYRDAENLVVHYLRFGTQTYHPVTKDVIEEEASCRLEISKASYYAKSLLHFIEAAADGRFSDRVIRLKLIGVGESVIFIDDDGGVFLGEGENPRQFSEVEFIHVRALMDAIGEAEGCLE